MAAYDAGILHKFADRLYRRADQSVLLHGFVGLLFGLGLFFLSAAFTSGFVGVCALLLATAIGVAIGEHRAFRLRLEAQRVLVQVQTELNTRLACEQLRAVTLATAHHQTPPNSAPPGQPWGF